MMNRLSVVPVDILARTQLSVGPVAVIIFELERFALQNRLMLTSGVDDGLGEYKSCSLRLETGELFLLCHFKVRSSYETYIFLEFGDKNPLLSIGRIRRALSLENSDVSWIDPQLVNLEEVRCQCLWCKLGRILGGDFD